MLYAAKWRPVFSIIHEVRRLPRILRRVRVTHRFHRSASPPTRREAALNYPLSSIAEAAKLNLASTKIDDDDSMSRLIRWPFNSVAINNARYLPSDRILLRMFTLYRDGSLRCNEMTVIIGATPLSRCRLDGIDLSNPTEGSLIFDRNAITHLSKEANYIHRSN